MKLGATLGARFIHRGAGRDCVALRGVGGVFRFGLPFFRLHLY